MSYAPVCPALLTAQYRAEAVRKNVALMYARTAAKCNELLERNDQDHCAKGFPQGNPLAHLGECSADIEQCAPLVEGRAPFVAFLEPAVRFCRTCGSDSFQPPTSD